MKKIILTAALALSLTACVTMPTLSNSAVDRAQARYDSASAWLDMIAPYLPAARVAQLRAAQAIAERALLAARAAATTAEQQAAVKRARAALDTIKS